MTNRSIALLAEDDTDCDTIRKILHRVLGDSTKTKKWAAKGCGELRRKLPAKLTAMSKEGCTTFIVIHDLDLNPDNGSLNDEVKLRETLEKKASHLKDVRKHICIPVEEMEAWFWSDPDVVRYIGRGKGEAKKNPHQLRKPKEELIKLSCGENRKPRYSTNMNVELAAMLDLELCSDRCPSFKNLLNFLHSLDGE